MLQGVNSHSAGVFDRTRPGGAGADSTLAALCLTLERVAVAKQARRQSKALVENILKQCLETFLKGRLLIKARPKVKIVTFRLIDY